MYGYIYKTTNLKNGKVYIGKHKSNKYDSSYLGSGRLLEQAIKKYGKENFSNEVLAVAFSDNELNQKEIYYISSYKAAYGKNCYNIAFGGEGGDATKYMSESEKAQFIEKMTQINRVRCNTDDFRKKISIATSNRYKDKIVRREHAEKLKKLWSDDNRRSAHSDLLKQYYQIHDRDCSFNNIPCVFELNEIKVEFESVKALREFLIKEYQYNPDRRTFKKLMEMGKQGIPYHPFHKSNEKLNKLQGMLIYKLDKSVETNGDECNHVEQEISTCSKCETVK